MQLSRGVWRAGVGVLAAVLGTTLPATEANAHAEAYGWGNCSYSYIFDPGGDAYVSNDPRYLFPPDSIHDGHVNSFNGRLADSVNRWAVEQSRYVNGWFAIEPPSIMSDVVVQYRNATQYSPLGTTFRIGSGGYQCVLHQTVDRLMLQSQVWINIRPDWFTQADARRGYWEGCDDRGEYLSYTCQKQWDVGSTIMHELGHAHGLFHPQAVDDHMGTPGFITGLAQCSSGALYHTMCGNLLYGYWTAGRTLDWWDQDSTRRLYEENSWP